MIDFDVGEELELVARTAREFARAQLLSHAREAEAARGVAAGVAARFAETGFAELELPEAQGGAGQGALARALVNEELAAGDPGAALALDPLGPAAPVLAELGGEAALREFALPLLAQPGARAVLVRAADGSFCAEAGRLSGGVAWVPADRVDLLVVLASEQAWLVREGVCLAPLRGAGLRAAGASELRLEGAPLLASLGGPAAATRALGRARLHAASLLVGVLRAAADTAREYALGRVAFGRPIAHHQALAFLLVDMHAAVDSARLLLHEAAWRADAGAPFEVQAAAAFVEAIEASTFVGPSAVQVLGGHGFMQDHLVEKHMREARALGLLFGGVDAAREDAGRALAACAPPLPLLEGEL
jgi:alkylation response protein AidB-like acyl-CoA dehydrogenase